MEFTKGKVVNKKKLKRWFFDIEWSILILIVLVLCIRIAAPYIGKSYINNVLANKLESYKGSISDLSLRVITGSYFIEGLKIYKKSNPQHPFVQSKQINIHLDWGMLFKGKAVLDIELFDSAINLIDSDEPEKRQLKISEKEAEHWSDALDAIVPLSIEQLVSNRLAVNLENNSLKGAEKAKIFFKTLSVHNLVDPEVHNSHLSPLKAQGSVNDHANVKIDGGINITKVNADLDINFEIKSFDMTSINKLLKHYVPVDLTSGSLSILAEIKGDTSKLGGYARVYIKNLDVLELDQDYKSATHFAIEWVGGFANWIIGALNDGMITTEIPFKKNEKGFELDSSKAFFNTLENLGGELPYQFKDSKDWD